MTTVGRARNEVTRSSGDSLGKVVFSKRKKLKPGAADEQREAVVSTRVSHGIESLEADEELIDDETFNKLQEQLTLAANQGEAEEAVEIWLVDEIVTELPNELVSDEALLSASVEPPPATPQEVVELEAEIAASKTRDDVVRHSLRLARRYASNAALFVVSGGTIAGLGSQGPDFTERLDGIMIPAEGDSILQAVVATARLVRCAVPTHGLDVRILRGIGRDKAREITMIPVTIRGRTINVLYADNGDSGIGITQIAGLRALALCIASSYEKIILERKGGPPQKA